MPVTISPTGAVMITGKSLEDVRLITLKHALRLEVFGMKRRGPSAYSILRSEYGYTGNKAAVLAAVTADIEAALAGTPAAAEKDQSTP